MSKPVYRNSAFWVIVALLTLIVASLFVLIFWVLYNEEKAELPDEDEGTAQIGMKWHPLARRERQFVEIIGRQRPDGVLTLMASFAQRGLHEAPIRPDLSQVPNPLSENPGLGMPGKAEKRTFFGKVDSPTLAKLRRFLEIGDKRRPYALLGAMQQGSQRRASEAPHRRAGLSTESRLARNAGIPMPNTCKNPIAPQIRMPDFG